VSSATDTPGGIPVTEASSGARRRERRGQGWPSYLIRRFVRLVVSIWVLFTATFAMIHLVPGDPVLAALGESATPELVTLREHQLGLDRPLLVQYFRYLGGVIHGDFGTSIVSSEPVSRIIADRLANTLSLALAAFVLTMVVAIPVGLGMAILTQKGRARGAEITFTTITGLLNSVPEFVLATALVAVFAVGLHALPVAGGSGLASYVLPVVALSAGSAATMSRIVRVEGLKVLSSDYIRAARGKRLPGPRIYLRHALPNMLTASLTYGGLLLSGLVAGTVIVENVFAWPGLGTQISQAVVGKDYPLIQGIIVVLGLLVLVINLGVDLLLAALDPRSRAIGLAR
jgi:peptide/nickel transport system permease protein